LAALAAIGPAKATSRQTTVGLKNLIFAPSNNSSMNEYTTQSGKMANKFPDAAFRPFAAGKGVVFEG
jgi:hypothetical protein